MKRSRQHGPSLGDGEGSDPGSKKVSPPPPPSPLPPTGTCVLACGIPVGLRRGTPDRARCPSQVLKLHINPDGDEKDDASPKEYYLVLGGSKTTVNTVYAVAYSSASDGDVRVRTISFPSRVLHLASAGKWCDEGKFCAFAACRDGSIFGILWECMKAIFEKKGGSHHGASSSCAVEFARHPAVRRISTVRVGWVAAVGLLKGAVLHQEDSEIPVPLGRTKLLTCISHVAGMGTFVGARDGSVVLFPKLSDEGDDDDDEARLFCKKRIIRASGLPVLGILPLLDGDGVPNGITVVGSAGSVESYELRRSPLLSESEPLERVRSLRIPGLEWQSGAYCSLPGGFLAYVDSGGVFTIGLGARSPTSRGGVGGPRPLGLTESAVAIESDSSAISHGSNRSNRAVVVLTRSGLLLRVGFTEIDEGRFLPPPQNGMATATMKEVTSPPPSLPCSEAEARARVKFLLLELPRLAADRSQVEARRASLRQSAAALCEIAEGSREIREAQVAFGLEALQREGLTSNYEVLISAELSVPEVVQRTTMSNETGRGGCFEWSLRLQVSRGNSCESVSSLIPHGSRSFRLSLPLVLSSPQPLIAQSWLELHWDEKALPSTYSANKREGRDGSSSALHINGSSSVRSGSGSGSGSDSGSGGAIFYLSRHVFDCLDLPHGTCIMNIADEVGLSGRSAAEKTGRSAAARDCASCGFLIQPLRSPREGDASASPLPSPSAPDILSRLLSETVHCRPQSSSSSHLSETSLHFTVRRGITEAVLVKISAAGPEWPPDYFVISVQCAHIPLMAAVRLALVLRLRRMGWELKLLPRSTHDASSALDLIGESMFEGAVRQEDHSPTLQEVYERASEVYLKLRS